MEHGGSPSKALWRMIAAAFGYLTPVQGALIQEAIDIAVILNALRALRIQPAGPGPMHPADGTLVTQEGIKR
jgi:hypothetical protein